MDEDSNLIAGVDLGDRVSEVCVYAQGVVIEQTQFVMTPECVRSFFGSRRFGKVAMEAGAQSAWVTRELRALGYEPLVANPRKLKAISSNERKCDRNDALLLAKLAAADASLLHPIHHRSAERADALAILRARDVAVVGRARLVHTIRSLAKSIGCRYPSSGTTEGFHRMEAATPPELVPAVTPLFAVIRTFNEQIKVYDAHLEAMFEDPFPEAKRLRQVNGVGPVTSLAFVLTLEDPKRFHNGRAAAAFLGLVPRRDQSGEVDRQLPISKTGNGMLRRLLVQCAQYILGPHGKDCDLRRWGQVLSERGGKNAKKRAITAVARRLAVLLFTLWKTGEVWEPLRNNKADEQTPDSERRPDIAVLDDCARHLGGAPDANPAREIAASTHSADPTMHQATTGPSKSADRSVERGTTPRGRVHGRPPDGEPVGSRQAPATPSAPAPRACAGDPAAACLPPTRPTVKKARKVQQEAERFPAPGGNRPPS